jgi:hypothetical protein
MTQVTCKTFTFWQVSKSNLRIQLLSLHGQNEENFEKLFSPIKTFYAFSKLG